MLKELLLPTALLTATQANADTVILQIEADITQSSFGVTDGPMGPIPVVCQSNCGGLDIFVEGRDSFFFMIGEPQLPPTTTFDIRPDGGSIESMEPDREFTLSYGADGHTGSYSLYFQYQGEWYGSQEALDVTGFSYNTVPDSAFIPEPAIWTLLLAGFTGLAFMGARRKA